MTIYEINIDDLEEYAQIPIAFEVTSIYQVKLVDQGLGGIQLLEAPTQPYVKDYDALENPLEWQNQFEIHHWGFLLARNGDQAVGGAAIAWNTNDVSMLEGRIDLSVLWDIRVHPKWRKQGIGTALFRHAAAWSTRRSCRQMKIETQNINVPACKFYARMGCELGDIRRFGYVETPQTADEIQLNWYLNL